MEVEERLGRVAAAGQVAEAVALLRRPGDGGQVRLGALGDRADEFRFGVSAVCHGFAVGQHPEVAAGAWARVDQTRRSVLERGQHIALMLHFVNATGSSRQYGAESRCVPDAIVRPWKLVCHSGSVRCGSTSRCPNGAGPPRGRTRDARSSTARRVLWTVAGTVALSHRYDRRCQSSQHCRPPNSKRRRDCVRRRPSWPT